MVGLLVFSQGTRQAQQHIVFEAVVVAVAVRRGTVLRSNVLR
jgi:hypothetical protein